MQAVLKGHNQSVLCLKGQPPLPFVVTGLIGTRLLLPQTVLSCPIVDLSADQRTSQRYNFIPSLDILLRHHLCEYQASQITFATHQLSAPFTGHHDQPPTVADLLRPPSPFVTALRSLQRIVARGHSDRPR